MTDFSARRAAIPTVYNTTQFRSRMEARWAAFFDLIGWTYVYEPFDGEGYIPDFMVNVPAIKNPVLVEVKPAVTHKEYREALRAMARRMTDWQHSMLVVGAAPYYSNPYNVTAGDGWDADLFRVPKTIWWVITPDDTITLRPCHTSRGLVGGAQCNTVQLDELWREAGNKVQWKPPVNAGGA